jgi:hypothetical protein
MLFIPILLAALVAAPASAGSLVGVWSVGEKRACDQGPAWVLFADGQYAEVTLPSGPISALGLWKDEETALAYTHAHMPFAGHELPAKMSRMTIEVRAADRLDMRNARGLARTFHRCPAASLKAPTSPAH